jgi:hypothetical protein
MSNEDFLQLRSSSICTTIIRIIQPSPYSYAKLRFITLPKYPMVIHILVYFYSFSQFIFSSNLQHWAFYSNVLIKIPHTEYVGPMCDLEVFASLGHHRICFDCIHSTSITEILLPPLPPPCLLEVWYRLFQAVFNVILVALCRLCYVQIAMPHTILPCGHISISCFYVPCLLPVLSSFAK